VIDDEVQRLLDGVPAERRMQARAAVTGSAADLAARVRRVEATGDGGWAAALSAAYMIDFAGRHCDPEQVALVTRELDRERDIEAVLDAAAERPPEELAAIAAELSRLSDEIVNAEWSAARGGAGQSLTREFLDRVIARRLPAVIAEMLAELRTREQHAILRGALHTVITTVRPAALARTILFLRGSRDTDLAEAILSEIARYVPSAGLAEFLAGVDSYGDDESVQAAIAGVAVWDEQASRIAEVVAGLLASRRPKLARRVVAAAVTDFARSSQQYLLYALVYVFKEHGLDDEADQIVAEISASAPDQDPIEMVIKFCAGERSAETVAFMQVILARPKDGVTAHAAAKLARSSELEELRPVIFAAVARWECSNLVEFERVLRGGGSGAWADEFCEVVAGQAADRDDKDDIGDIVLWLLRDADTKRGRRLAGRLVAGTVRLRRPDLAVALICKLRDQQVTSGSQQPGWLSLRDEAAEQIALSYDAEDMVRLVGYGEEVCLPAVLRLAPEWLTSADRSHPDIVRLVAALRQARGNRGELLEMLQYCGQVTNLSEAAPVTALRDEGLTDEADAWNRGMRPMSMWRRRPDPERLR
jgi:hypothetical protein